MIKKNMPLIILTSLLTFLPAILMKSGLPLILVLVHLVCIYATGKDKGNQDQNPKVFRMVLWICPVMAIYIAGVNYLVLSGQYAGMEILSTGLIGLIFIIVGNYLPKCKKNSTIGIRIPWTFSSEENWNKTHRFGGKVFVVCGLVMMCSIFIPGKMGEIVLVGSMFIMILLPIIYSYLFYRKEKPAGKASLEQIESAKIGKGTVIFLIVIFAYVAVMMFTGDIEFTCGEETLEIEAAYWSDMTIGYDEIESIVYLEEDEAGSRISGYGSARLLMGTFKNEEYGYHTRYSYTQCDTGIVLDLGKSVLIISGKDVENTEKVYEELVDKIGAVALTNNNS